MPFYLYISGEGGCDYTVACNKVLIPLGGATRDEATAEAKRLLVGPEGSGEGGYYGAEKIADSRVTLFETVAAYEIPLRDWLDERDEANSRAANEAEREQRLELYRKLQTEFGGRESA